MPLASATRSRGGERGGAGVDGFDAFASLRVEMVQGRIRRLMVEAIERAAGGVASGREIILPLIKDSTPVFCPRNQIGSP